MCDLYFRNARSTPLSNLNKESDLKWIQIYKSEYTLSALLCNMACDILIPVSMSFAIAVSILCNFAVIRISGIVLKVALLNLSILSLSVVLIQMYIGSTLFHLRKIAIQNRIRNSNSKLVKKLLKGCRARRMYFGPFYDITYKFMLAVMNFIVIKTVRLLIASQ